MKRSWFGFFLLAALLILALGASWGMERIHQPIAQDLIQAAQCAQDGRWEQAQALLGRAGARWAEWDGLRACLADHTPVEEIDAELSQLPVYAQARQAADFAAACLSTARKVAAMGQAHGLGGGNLL